VTRLALKKRLDNVGTDYDHWQQCYQNFQKMEIYIPYYGLPDWFEIGTLAPRLLEALPRR
jgi:hypothetical protein